MNDAVAYRSCLRCADGDNIAGTEAGVTWRENTGLLELASFLIKPVNL